MPAESGGRNGDGRHPGWWWAPAVLAAIAIYLTSLPSEFLFDDIHVVAHNPLVCGGDLDVGRIFRSDYWAGVFQDERSAYRPLTILLHAAVCHVAGAVPAAHRALNLLFHALVAFLVFLVFLRALAPTRGPPLAAALASAAFAVHPLNSEAVIFVSNRSEIVGTAASLGVLLLVHAYVFRPAPVSRRRRDFAGIALLAGIAAVQAVGIFSKENAVAAPALALLFLLGAPRGTDGDDRPARLPLQRAGVALAFSLAAIGAYLAARAVVLGGLYHGTGFSILDNPLAHAATLDRIRTAFAVLGRYLALFVAPLHLSADYSFAQIPPVTAWADPSFLVGAVSCAALAGVGVLSVRRSPVVALGIAWFLVAIFPVSNLAFPIGTIMAERLCYLPGIGLFLAVAAGAAGALRARTAPRTRRWAGGAAIGALAVLSGLTLQRIAETRTNCGFFERTAEASPRSAKALYGLGICALDRGQDLGPAIAAFDRSLRIYPDYEDAAIQLAQALERTGHLDDAVARLGGFVGAHPNATQARFALAKLLARNGRRDEARLLFDELVTRHPDHPEFREFRRRLDAP